MKKTTRVRALLCALCLLLPPFASPALAGATLTPLDEMDTSGMSKAVPLEQVNLSLMLPLNAEYEVLLSEAGHEGLRIYLPDHPDVIYLFFAAQDSTMASWDLQSLTPAQVETLYEFLAAVPETLTHTVFPDAIPNYPALRVKESRAEEELYMEHLLVLHDDWIFDMVVAPFDGTPSIAKEDAAAQTSMLAATLSAETFTARHDSYALPGGGPVLSLPGAKMTLATDEAYYKQLYLRPTGGASQTVLTIHALRNPLYAGEGIQTIDEETRLWLLDYVSLGDPLSETLRYEMPEGASGSMLFFSSDDRYPPKNSPAAHLLALCGGWAIEITYMPLEGADTEWALAAQRALMESLLTAASALSTYPIRQVGDTLLFSLTTGTLTVTIPDGYALTQMNEETNRRIVALASLENPLFYELYVMENEKSGGKTLDQLCTPEALDEMAKSLAENVRDRTGDSASHEVLESGLLNVCTLGAHTDNLRAQLFYAEFDGYAIHLYCESPASPLSAEDITGLLELAAFAPLETAQGSGE